MFKQKTAKNLEKLKVIKIVIKYCKKKEHQIKNKSASNKKLLLTWLTNKIKKIFTSIKYKKKIKETRKTLAVVAKVVVKYCSFSSCNRSSHSTTNNVKKRRQKQQKNTIDPQKYE